MVGWVAGSAGAGWAVVAGMGQAEAGWGVAGWAAAGSVEEGWGEGVEVSD